MEAVGAEDAALPIGAGGEDERHTGRALRLDVGDEGAIRVRRALGDLDELGVLGSRVDAHLGERWEAGGDDLDDRPGWPAERQDRDDRFAHLVDAEAVRAEDSGLAIGAGGEDERHPRRALRLDVGDEGAIRIRLAPGDLGDLGVLGSRVDTHLGERRKAGGDDLDDPPDKPAQRRDGHR